MNIEGLKNYFESGKTKSLEARIQSLESLEALISINRDEICQALYKDLRKPKQEALISEVAFVLEEIRLVKKKLGSWMAPKSVGNPLALWPAKSKIYYEALGIVLIIAPWNYPFQLAIAPLVGAIAAGNCAVIKPSELTPHTSKLISSLFEKYFSCDYIKIVEGGIPETTDLLNTKFDHIFFTGSTAVGKIVMQAASKNLVPVTLELGGKSPVIVCEDADLNLAARRIVWGRFYNAGQTCVSPDYLYVHQSVKTKLIEKIKANIEEQFGKDPRRSQSFARIVNLKNHQRLMGMIQKDKVAHGGDFDEEDLYIGPTVLTDVSWDDPVMQEEIFGPILPIMDFDNLEDTFKTIRAKPKPLAGYFFSQSKRTQEKFIQELSFGGGSINDVIIHLSNPHLPFGGVGESGMGAYHGEFSFKTFSHAKSVIYRSGKMDFSARYAPYNDRKLNLLKRIFRI